MAKGVYTTCTDMANTEERGKTQQAQTAVKIGAPLNHITIHTLLGRTVDIYQLSGRDQTHRNHQNQ